MNNSRDINLFRILKQQGKLTKVKLYLAREAVDDPYENTKTLTYYPHIDIKAYVSTLSFDSLKWKYYGQLPGGSKQLICESRWLTMIKEADKIDIGGDYYRTYRVGGKGFMIKEHKDYIVVILERLEQ